MKQNCATHVIPPQNVHNIEMDYCIDNYSTKGSNTAPFVSVKCAFSQFLSFLM